MSLIKRIQEWLRRSKLVVCAGVVAASALTLGAASVKHVSVIADGETAQITTLHSQPEKIVAEAGIEMGEGDELRLSTLRVKDETEIHVIRAVPVHIDMDGTVKEIKTARPTVGTLLKKLGVDREKYESSLNDDALIRAGLVIRLRTPEERQAEEQQAAEQEFVRVRDGGQYVETSRGHLRYTDCLVMEASAYLPTDGSEEGLTATGIPARYGVVAVDPDVIPLGTRLYIPGYGVALAADTGGMIEGAMIDLCMEDYDECIQFGRRDIDVYVLDM